MRNIITILCLFWTIVASAQTVTVTRPQNTQQTTQKKTTASYSNGKLVVNGVTYDMVRVQGGTFQMGHTIGYAGADDDSAPAHQVTLSSYYIGKTEVTQALWKTIMGTNPSNFKGNNKPVESVSWNDCKTFISKLNALTGKNFRLPTEAEWEYAVRKGNGNQGLEVDNFAAIAWSDGTTHDVATKQPNGLGIYDMIGNVDEWCSDWYGRYSSSGQTNPIGPSGGSKRVVRGGNWQYASGFVNRRSSRSPDEIKSTVGLRLALSE